MNNALKCSMGVPVLLTVFAFNAQSDVITFSGSSDYDNTANTVTGTNASPVYNNNQTGGKFRDVFWWGSSFNGGIAGVTSPDFINAGMNLVSNGGSPAHAVVGGDNTALNFTGLHTSSGGLGAGTTFLTIYDTTPGDGTATRNLFDFSGAGGLTISADILFAPGQHNVSGGLVALYNEGQDGLALLANNGGGANQDIPSLRLVFRSNLTGIVLTSVPLPATSFVGDTDGTVNTGPLSGDHWYRMVMNLSINTGLNTWTETGSFFNHTDPTDPNSALGSLIGSLNFNGLLGNQTNGLNLTNPGEIGLAALTSEGFGDGVDTVHGGTGANPLVDNIGISITNFTTPTSTPEPSSFLALAAGGALVVALRRRMANRG